MMRLYSAQQEAVVQQAVQGAQKDTSARHAWMLPAIGMLGMVGLAAGLGVAVYKRIGRRSTRSLRAIDGTDSYGELLPDLEGPVE